MGRPGKGAVDLGLEVSQVIGRRKERRRKEVGKSGESKGEREKGETMKVNKCANYMYSRFIGRQGRCTRM